MSTITSLALRCPIEWYREPPPWERPLSGTVAWCVLAVMGFFVIRAVNAQRIASPFAPELLTGARRTVHVVALATIAWAGAVAFSVSWVGLGEETTVVAAATAVAAAAGGIRRATIGIARFSSASMVAVIILCVVDLQPRVRMYPRDSAGPAGIARDALGVLLVAGPALIVLVELLIRLERRHAARTQLPPAIARH